MPRFDDPRAAFADAGMVVFERGWLSSNGALFAGGGMDEATLVDSGYVSHAEQTVALVQHALVGRPLWRILNTHLHSDHCGGNARLQAAYASEVWVPMGEFEKARSWDTTRLTFEATGQRCPRFAVRGSVCAGETVLLSGLPWEVLASPGHDPESVVLYQRERRLLLSADALWENGFGVVFPELEGESAFDQLGLTLDGLATLQIDWVVPGHGRPFSGVGEAIDRARRRLDAFRIDPRRHALHAAKVLLKFHLLEVRREALTTLLRWGATVRYLQWVHRDHFQELPIECWCGNLVDELARSGAVRIDGCEVVDC